MNEFGWHPNPEIPEIASQSLRWQVSDIGSSCKGANFVTGRTTKKPAGRKKDMTKSTSPCTGYDHQPAPNTTPLHHAKDMIKTRNKNRCARYVVCNEQRNETMHKEYFV
jgi:hypothetical protein